MAFLGLLPKLWVQKSRYLSITAFLYLVAGIDDFKTKANRWPFPGTKELNPTAFQCALAKLRATKKADQ